MDRTEGDENRKANVKAIVIERYGGPEVMQLKELDLGNPGPGLATAGVNFVDIYQRRRTYARKLLVHHASRHVFCANA
jgi:NADPH:quinone reductase-like Zn-dependent oxidoreductase